MWENPDHHESICCPLCESEPEAAIVVGLKARFDMAVRNIACRRCGLVRIDPRPTVDAMDAYYRGPYREQYGTVKIPHPTKGFVGREDAETFEEALVAQHTHQALIALRLAPHKRGAKVLEVGCRDGRTLARMRDEHQLEVWGVEPGPAEAQEARERGIPVFEGLLEELDPGAPGAAAEFPESFDHVQMFHVLEHIHDPLDALIRMRQLLAPGGTLLIEVPNVACPYGPLEANFFQNAHLFNFSANTLMALFRRAGLLPEKLIDRTTLYLTGTVDPEVEATALPLPFDDGHLRDAWQDGCWVADSLDTYRHLERLRPTMESGQIDQDGVSSLLTLLKRPGFPTHTKLVLDTIVERLVTLGAPRIANTILQTALAGPHPTSVLERWVEPAPATHPSDERPTS